MKPNQHGDFSDTMEQVDVLFATEILPEASKLKGFIDIQRMMCPLTGECIILSFWESEEDCNKSYSWGIFKMHEFASDGVIKTKQFACMTMFKGRHAWSSDAMDHTLEKLGAVSQIRVASPFVRVTTMTMEVPKG